MLATDRFQHTWTEGNDYRIRDNGDHLIVTSDAGTEKIRKEDCDPELFREVFGLTI